MLVATLNVNQPELTNNLVEQISKDKKIKHEIMVLENGATEPSKYSTHISEKNYFFGGGLNLIIDYFLNETKHDWLFVLNCDLIIHGQNFLSMMLSEAEKHDVCQLSPTIINASIEQCAWKQMHNWMSGTTRYVQWIDFQCPLLRRDIVERIGQYPLELIYGWGNDFYTGLVAEELKLKSGVTDKVCITHLNSQTMNKGVEDLDGNVLTPSEYCSRAERGMNEFMKKYNWERFNQFKHNAFNYEYRS
tara:strand:+ start:2277 stop:3017 length:741 start_codon:yes stop_codon:yes gene_type:complete